MQKSEALALFNIPSDEDAEDILRQKAFDVYSPMFTREILPQLLDEKRKKLELIGEAMEAFGIQQENSQLITADSSGLFGDDIIASLERYEKESYRLRAELSRAGSIRDKIETLDRMSRLRLAWCRAVLEKTGKVKPEAGEIALSSATDFSLLKPALLLFVTENKMTPVLVEEVVKSERILEKYERRTN